MDSIRDKTIGRLTNYRQLTSAEQAELDTLAVALDLNENDPMWGQIGWAWAVLPRQEKFDMSHRALAAEIRSDLQSLLDERRNDETNSVGGVRSENLDEIKAMIQAVADRASVAVVDHKMIHSAMVSALEKQEKQKGVVTSTDILGIIKDAVVEVVSWVNAVLAAFVIGICLFVGYQFGKSVQAGSDDTAVQKMEKQISDLTAALPKR